MSNAPVLRGAGGADGLCLLPVPAQGHSPLCVFNTLLAGADGEGMVAMITHPPLLQIRREGPFLNQNALLLPGAPALQLHACVCGHVRNTVSETEVDSKLCLLGDVLVLGTDNTRSCCRFRARFSLTRFHRAHAVPEQTVRSCFSFCLCINGGN